MFLVGGRRRSSRKMATGSTSRDNGSFPRSVVKSDWLTSMMSVEAKNNEESESVLSQVQYNWVTGEHRDTAWPPAA